MFSAALLDVDGTLVDSNDAHAHAWVKAFAQAGVRVAFDDVRWKIGMGGDKLMPAVSGISEDSPTGTHISERRRSIFKQEFLPQLRPFRDAGRLVAALKSRGVQAVVASSAKKDELATLLAIADAESLIGDSTSSDDADESKPDPDIVHAALTQAGSRPEQSVLIGDTPYDVEAAGRAGVAAIAFRCGGWNDEALAGAVAIYDGPWHLLARLDDLFRA